MPLFTQQSASTHAPAYPRHVVTAILVAHDGARWLPGTLTGILGQERPVQRVVAVDTGSTDATPRLLEDALGPASVMSADRRTSFGAAIAEAVRTVPFADEASLPYGIDGYAPGADPYGPDAFGGDDYLSPRSGELVEWLWLLHDDSEPAPDALHLLLRAADELPSAGVLGPKIRSWYDRRQLLEVGTTIARSGRRWTGLERREQDQGQHDAVRGVLSVGSAGMLVRRDVWEQLGGFDKRLAFGRDDTDFGWRANAAGHRVVVVPEAVVLHAEAATRERRPIDCAPNHPHRVDRAGAVYTLLANATGKTLPLVWLRLFFGTFLRALGYLVGKLPRMALDEFLGVYKVLLRPDAIIAGRHKRSRTRVAADAEFRDLFPPRGAGIRHAVDTLFGNISRRVEPEGARARQSVLESGPTSEDADDLHVENFARLRAVVQRPGIALAAGLVLVTLLAARDVLSGGDLVGGALLPAPDSAADLWHRFTESWHGVGLGGNDAAPPYLALVAGLGTLLFGSASAAVSVLLIGSVPLAGISAYLSGRKLVPNKPVRAWAAAAYALMPVATGAIAAGRLGTAVVLVLAPIVARGLAVTAGLGGQPGTWRAAWATALAVAAATAFVPLSWVFVVVLAVAALPAAVLAGRLGAGLVLRLAVVVVVPLVLLMPWTPAMFGGDRLFLEPGLTPDGLAERGTSPVGLLLLDPGGPGTLPAVFGAGLLLAALAALLRDSRRTAVLAGWAAATVGLIGAVAISRMEVTAPADGHAVAAWPGLATVVVGLGYLAAAAVGAEDARARVAASSFGWRQPAAVVVAAVAALTPVAAAGWWMWQGADGPVSRKDGPYVPAFVASDNSTADRARTLVLRTDPGGAVRSVLVRGSGVYLGDPDVAPEAKKAKVFDDYVAAFLSGTGSADTAGLSDFAVRYVLVQAPADPALVARLDGTPGLVRKSSEHGTPLWRVEGTNARAVIENPDGASFPLSSTDDGVSTRIDPGPDGRVLRLAERADSGWKATLDGKPLTVRKGDAGDWGQQFTLPAGGGRLSVTHESGGRGMWLAAEGLLLLVVVVLALPARRRGNDDDMPDSPAAVGAGAAESAVSASLPGGGRRARREAAAAEAAAEAAGMPAPEPGGVPPESPAETTGSLFVPAQQGGTGTADDQEDDWDLGQYARGFQPRETQFPGDSGYQEPGQNPGQNPGYGDYAATPYAPAQDGYGQSGGYDGAGYEQNAYPGGYPDGGYDPNAYDPNAYPQQGGYSSGEYAAYDPQTGAPVWPQQPPQQPQEQPGSDTPWPPPPQQPPHPGSGR
ncbi:glycosyltransferase [Uniformispora flossi]|uniref:glycosyltransferase family 2 protein n=2 Tax=Uniformispora flossi TaxID=3390723 RepID=UPI003C2E0216